MILIIDFGSQYNQLIARRVRENHVYCQIEPPDIPLAVIKALHPEGIILSGGPASIYGKGAPRVDKGIFNLGIPVLGICYGLQYMVDSLGGKVIGSQKRENGFAELLVKKQSDSFKGVTKKTQCWMSHGDSIGSIPAGFTLTASPPIPRWQQPRTPAAAFTAFNFIRNVVHTREGKKMLSNFLFDICRCEKYGSMKIVIHNAVEEIRRQVARKKHAGPFRRR